MEEIIHEIGDPELRAQVERVASFHGHLSTGAFVGIQMLNLARRVLDLSKEVRLFVICETYNCLPDPFQVLAGCTIGNKGLRIRDHGKMAATVSPRGPSGGLVKAVRIILDPAKTAKYPRLHSWFMKTCKISHLEAISVLIEAEESVYTWKFPRSQRRLSGYAGAVARASFRNTMNCSASPALILLSSKVALQARVLLRRI